MHLPSLAPLNYYKSMTRTKQTTGNFAVFFGTGILTVCCFPYNLFRLFFLASIFFLSTGTFTLSGPSFLGAADAPPRTVEGAAFWSCEFRPNAFVAVEVDMGARIV
jgi:hypothetical protein